MIACDGRPAEQEGGFVIEVEEVARIGNKS
jgi:hypothetical protein